MKKGGAGDRLRNWFFDPVALPRVTEASAVQLDEE